MGVGAPFDGVGGLAELLGLLAAVVILLVFLRALVAISISGLAVVSLTS